MTNHVEIERGEAPLAPFYVERQPWMKRAACTDAPTELFFHKAYVKEAIEVCALCPVRKQCGKQALIEELALSHGRYGVRGGMSAPQRTVLWRRGGLHDKDGMLLAEAQGIPVEGDQWSRHLSTLTRKTYQHLVAKSTPGRLVSPGMLSKHVGCNVAPMRRVCEELLIMEVLGVDERGRYVYRGPGNESDLPRYLRASGERDSRAE